METRTIAKIGTALATAFIIALVAGVFVGALITGTARSERAECIKWSNDAHIYPAYYITGWQRQQCNQYGINITAPVVGPDNVIR